MIHFFTAATGKYNMFVLPYIASVQWSNPSASIEILTDKPRKYEECEMMLKNVTIRNIPDEFKPWIRNKQKSQAIRFLTYPDVRKDYTYIGDVDIIVLEDILQQHVDNMKKIRKPYSNIVRPNSQRLTGLHFVDTDKWYGKLRRWPTWKLMEVLENKTKSDEQTLYWITRRLFGVPDASATFRPVHGIHTSLNRNIDPKNDIPGWGAHPQWLEKYKELRESEEWKTFYPYFDHKYTQILKQIESKL